MWDVSRLRLAAAATVAWLLNPRHRSATGSQGYHNLLICPLKTLRFLHAKYWMSTKVVACFQVCRDRLPAPSACRSGERVVCCVMLSKLITPNWYGWKHFRCLIGKIWCLYIIIAWLIYLRIKTTAVTGSWYHTGGSNSWWGWSFHSRIIWYIIRK